MSDFIDFTEFTKNIICPECNKNLSGQNIKIVRCEDDGITIVQIKCPCCLKSFALGIFGLTKKEIQIMLNAKIEPKPISYDDILNFHKIMPDFEKRFYKYINKT